MGVEENLLLRGRLCPPPADDEGGGEGARRVPLELPLLPSVLDLREDDAPVASARPLFSFCLSRSVGGGATGRGGIEGRGGMVVRGWCAISVVWPGKGLECMDGRGGRRAGGRGGGPVDVGG